MYSAVVLVKLINILIFDEIQEYNETRILSKVNIDDDLVS